MLRVVGSDYIFLILVVIAPQIALSPLSILSQSKECYPTHPHPTFFMAIGHSTCIEVQNTLMIYIDIVSHCICICGYYSTDKLRSYNGYWVISSWCQELRLYKVCSYALKPVACLPGRCFCPN